MRTRIALIAALSLAFGHAKRKPCDCAFTVQITGHDLGLPRRMCCFGIEGKAGKKEAAAYEAECAFIHGKPIDCTAEWFTERAPCGTDKHCVTRVVYELDTFGYAADPTEFQNVRVHITLE